VGGSYFAPTYYIFQCRQYILYLYCSIITVLIISTVILTGFEYCQKEKWRHLKIIVFVAFSAFGVIPAIHASIAIKDVDWDLFAVFITMYSVYAVGLTFYTTRFPERFWPGKFDYWFCSHTIWHIFVDLGVLVHLILCLMLWKKAKEGCLID